MNDEKAPHGYEDDGVTPKTPYGIKVDGTPRKSRRGATAGSRGNTASPAKKTSAPRKSATDVQRKSMFVDMTTNFVVMPLIAASRATPVVRKIGQNQANALAGDGYIISQLAGPIFDGLNVYSQTNPKALSWLDTVEEKAPILQLAMVGIQLIKAIAANHITPNPEMAEAGRQTVKNAAEQMMAEVERMAAEAGMTPEDFMSAQQMANA